jgi:acetoin utilization deacetylase AcuC-like enzyme
MRAIDRILEHERFQALERESAPMGTMVQAALAHPDHYVENLETLIPTEGLARLDDDTTLSPGSWEAAMRGVGAVCGAVDEVMPRKVKNAFCAIRPPGHHAEHNKAMGFCLFNNAAIAARWAQKTHGATRVAIMDWDVHHGNGTQDIFYNDPTVMYTSTHQMPLYPGTGEPNETGIANNIVNAPLRAGDAGGEFREAFEVAILPAIDRFAPDLIIISAGFDAHMRDPLGQVNLVESDFAWATLKLMELADKHAGGRLVSVLEGGYDLEGLARSTAAHVMTLMKA